MWRIIASDGTVDDLDDTSLEFCRDVAQAFASLGASVRFVRAEIEALTGARMSWWSRADAVGGV